MRFLDSLFGWLLLLGSLLHCFGAYYHYKSTPELLLWAEGSNLSGLLLAGMNILRVGRPLDRQLGWLCFAGCLGWLAISFALAHQLGDFFNPRTLIHGSIAMVLAIFSLRTALGKASIPPIP
jgi:peptidoglycan/LPS O-acetylase OafA/YrhL